MSKTNIVDLPRRLEVPAAGQLRLPWETDFPESNAKIVPLHRRKDPAVYKPQPDRGADPDYWPTVDADLIRLLIYRVLPMLPPGIIWECAAGQGHLVDPMRQAGRIVIATDLYPGRSDIARHNFLVGQPPPETKGAIAVTNGPYSPLTEFLMRGLRWIDTGHLAGFVLLTRLGADTTDGRAAAFNRAAYEWRTCWRPWWKPRQKGDRNPRFTAQWTAWLRGHPGPPTSWHIRRAEAGAQQLGLFDYGT